MVTFPPMTVPANARLQGPANSKAKRRCLRGRCKALLGAHLLKAHYVRPPYSRKTESDVDRYGSSHSPFHVEKPVITGRSGGPALVCTNMLRPLTPVYFPVP